MHAYRVWLREGVGDDELENIRARLQQERSLGNTTFQAMAEKALGRPVKLRTRGRPRSLDNQLDGAVSLRPLLEIAPPNRFSKWLDGVNGANPLSFRLLRLGSDCSVGHRTIRAVAVDIERHPTPGFIVAALVLVEALMVAPQTIGQSAQTVHAGVAVPV